MEVKSGAGTEHFFCQHYHGSPQLLGSVGLNLAMLDVWTEREIYTLCPTLEDSMFSVCLLCAHQ